MLDKILSGGNTKMLNNFAGGQYYQEIPRLDDLATSTIGLKTGTINLEQIRINPARVTLDELVERSLEELSQQLLKLKDAPVKNDITSKTVSEIIVADNLGANPQNILKKELQRLGHTGKLVQATRKLNSSGLSNTDRQILSKEGILFYAAYRAVIGFETLDTAGINTNVFDSLEKVKSHINQVLVDKVINRLNLDATDVEKADLKDNLSKLVISYERGDVEAAVLGEFEKIKSAGSLIDLVLEFLNSGEVELPFNADISAIAESMVQYLIDIGYDPNEADPLEELIETRFSEIQQSLEDQKAELITLIEDKLNDATQARTDLRDQLTSSLDQKTTELTTKLTQLENKQTEDSNLLNTKLTDVSKAVDDQQKQLTTMNRDTTEVKTGLEELGMKQQQDNEKGLLERKEIKETIEDLIGQAAKIDQTINEVNQLKDDLIKDKETAAKERQELADQTTALAKKSENADKLITKLEASDKKITSDSKSERAKLKTLINNLQKQVDDLQRQIDELSENN